MKHLLVIVALLAGCAEDPPARWVRAGATANDFETDRGQCQAQAFAISSPAAVQVAIVFNGCMRGKGWRLMN